MAKVPGSLWIEGNDLHYVDQFEREWYMPGTWVRNQTAVAGSIYTDLDGYLYFINEAGNQLYRIIFALYSPRPPMAAQISSLWIDASDNQLHWVGVPETDTVRYGLRGHNDVAGVSTHTDQHFDAIHTDTHTDTPHNDIAHIDQYGGTSHTDTHNDIPHTDFNDSYHEDYAENKFNDHMDGYKQYYWEHLDAGHPPIYGTHMDSWAGASGVHNDCTHGDTGGNAPCDDHWDGIHHVDFAHVDVHSDSPHQDNPAYGTHNDFWDSSPHQDRAHTDIAHTDGHVDLAHTDSHNDTHADVAHTDHPIYVGP